MTWQYEHGTAYEVPDRIARAEGLVDMSWHNDVCPSFGVDGLGDDDLRLWVDHVDPNQRECFGARFVVNYTSYDVDSVPDLPDAAWGAVDPRWNGPDGLGTDLYAGDDPDAALCCFLKALHAIRSYRATHAAADPWDAAQCRSYGEPDS